jgi:hypothetical protein
MGFNDFVRAGIVAIGLAAAAAPAAQANYIFSGSGSSGNFTGQAGEPFSVNFDWPYGGTQPDWGSPGVGATVTPYLEALPAYGLDLTFHGAGPIDAASILIGNGANCAGSSFGGTTFCTIGSPNDIWIAFLTGPDSISFRAQNASFYLSPGQLYFVNVFFTYGTAAPTSFDGVWLTDFSPNPNVPEPATLALFGAGLAGFRLFRRKKAA